MTQLDWTTLILIAAVAFSFGAVAGVTYALRELRGLLELSREDAS